jgi:hypothetical protein
MSKGCLKPAHCLCSVLTALAMLAPAQGYAGTGPSGPFLGLSGQWTGIGTITMPDGSTRQLRCNSANAVGANGTAIEQKLHCTGGSFRFDITSNAAAKGGWVSGIWAETERGVRGNLSGRVSRSAILAHIAGNGFAARMLCVLRATGSWLRCDPSRSGRNEGRTLRVLRSRCTNSQAAVLLVNRRNRREINGLGDCREANIASRPLLLN